jgi:putative transposase
MNKINIKNRKKNRLDAFHYNNWYFFVTINVNNHQKVFGDIVGEEMVLNKYGKIMEEQRFWLKKYENVSLYNFVVMPNHFHWIIGIENVGNGRDRSLQRKWLSSIIWAFKTTSSKLIRESWLQSFKRQKSFYDHIIRNENDMNRIIEYIELNPYAWKNDEYYK